VNVPKAELLCNEVAEDGPKSSQAPPTLVMRLPALCPIALVHIAPDNNSARYADFLNMSPPIYFAYHINYFASMIFLDRRTDAFS
jgi:hypothetical protein